MFMMVHVAPALLSRLALACALPMASGLLLILFA